MNLAILGSVFLAKLVISLGGRIEVYGCSCVHESGPMLHIPLCARVRVCVHVIDFLYGVSGLRDTRWVDPPPPACQRCLWATAASASSVPWCRSRWIWMTMRQTPSARGCALLASGLNCNVARTPRWWGEGLPGQALQGRD